MSLRLEKGFGAWSLDFREDFTPAESGLDAFINFRKKDFIGKESAKRDKSPARRRVLLIVNAAEADAKGDEPVYAGDAHIGFITSGGYGHCIGESLAMAMIDSARIKEGAKCAVEILGDLRPARISLRPPYDPEGEKMRG